MVILQARWKKEPKGVALFEVLISMALIALWLLASAGLQSSMLRMGKSADTRQKAIALAADLSERIEANKSAAISGAYSLPAQNTPSSTKSCYSNSCTGTELAAFDLSEWYQNAVNQLINATVSVTFASTSTVSSYTINIAWQEPKGRQTYADTSSMTETASYVTIKTLR